jgi:hypothetical protein
MAFKASPDKAKFEVRCMRCHGPMASEKFYDNSRSFYGYHCVLCGEILDPVILLHRVSQNANIAIPEGAEEILLLIKKYLSAKPKGVIN